MAEVDVVTRAYDNDRSGRFPAHPMLTADVLASRGVRLLHSLPMRDDARGMDAQPLVLSGIRLGLAPGGQPHDVAFCLTNANKLVAWHVHTGDELGVRLLGRPVKSNKAIDYHEVNDFFGGLSTPVYDPDTRTLYAVVWTSPDYTVARARHLIFAVDVDTLADRRPALDLSDATYSAGRGYPTHRLSDAARKQRAALAFYRAKGSDGAERPTVLVPFGSVSETGGKANGWLIAVDTQAWSIGAAWTVCAGGRGGGIWQAGGGPVVDPEGGIIVMTGNGDFNPDRQCYGDCFVRLFYDPARNKFVVSSWWTPFTAEARLGHDPDTEDEAVALPTNYRPKDAGQRGALADQDLGAGSPTRIARYNEIAGGGKDGLYYRLHGDDFGSTTFDDLKDPKGRNYPKLAAPPVFGTFYPGPEHDPAPQEPETLNLQQYLMHHQHGALCNVFVKGIGQLVVGGGENEHLRVWKVVKGKPWQFLASSEDIASPYATGAMGGMPGWFSCIAGDVIWTLVPMTCANTGISKGALKAYHLTRYRTRPDGSKTLIKLWDSSEWNIDFDFCKFGGPTPFRDLVVCPTYDGRLLVFG